MIITIRGSNGSGKSTIVRQVMECYDNIIQVAYPPEHNKRKPMGYICQHDLRRLFVPGHYEIVNGGIDTLPDLDYAYNLILEHHALAADCLYEGKNYTDRTKRILHLKSADLDIRVIHLNSTLQECIAAVCARGHKIDEKTIKRLYVSSWKDVEVFKKYGVPCFALSRQEALQKIQEWLAIASRPAHTNS